MTYIKTQKYGLLSLVVTLSTKNKENEMRRKRENNILFLIE